MFSSYFAKNCFIQPLHNSPNVVIEDNTFTFLYYISNGNFWQLKEQSLFGNHMFVQCQFFTKFSTIIILIKDIIFKANFKK